MSNRKTIWTGIFVESAMIIFSVFIALFINEWKNERNEAAKTELIIENIENEIQHNRKVLENVIGYHEDVLARLSQQSEGETLEQKYFKNGRFALEEIIPNGIMQDQFQDIAWIVATEDKITNRIPLEESQALFAVYEQKRFLDETLRKILDYLTSREVHRKELVSENVFVLSILMNELIGQEKMLIAKSKTALEAISKRQNKSQ